MCANRFGFRAVIAIAALVLSSGVSHGAFNGFVRMSNGYFIDGATGEPWLPHGIAYQTWNRPLGVWQTWDQINYDLDEMVKMGANSIRVDFVWQHIEEQGDNQFSWDNYDYLVQECEKRNIRIFALVGYQWPPNWFPDNWYTMHPPETDAEGIYHTNRWQSDIIGYETPEARAQYGEWISNVCGRYKDSKAIAGWIVGNEYGYLGLWSGLLDGYDTNCETAFRGYVQQKYTTVTNANNKLGTAYTAFSQVKFVDQYRAYGVEGAVWADMVQWREDSIASFTALSAKAAKLADTNHLISYSTVGMQWGEEDWRYHAEDRGKITSMAAASNAPIDFFSVNNYPWSILGHESQNGHWGVSYTKKVAKVPVLYTETGFTSSETMWPGMNEIRQGPLIRNALWESLEAGAIGTHIFSWMDRPYITDREKGFGIVYSDRGTKPAFWVSRSAYNLMDQIDLQDLLAGSQDPTPDIAFLWTAANDSQYNRYECEMQQIAGALERLGYEPNFVDLNDLSTGVYTNYKLIILPRNMRVEDTVPGSGQTVLDFLRTQVIGAGIHVLASADIPGLQNFNGRARTQVTNEVRSLFGVSPHDIGGFEVPMRRREFVTWYWTPITVNFTTNAVGAVAGGYSYRPIVWKYNDEITVSTGGVVWATMDSERNKGFEAAATPDKWGFWSEPGGNISVQQNWGWQYAGTNMLQMWGDSVLWQSFPAVPFGRYTFNMQFRNNSDDALKNGSIGLVAIEWWGTSNQYLGVTESPMIRTNTPGNTWVKYMVDAQAPSNTYEGRRVIRVQGTNLVKNGALTGTGTQPTSWSNWFNANHDPVTGVKLGTAGNSWSFFNDGGLYQDITNGFSAGETLRFGGWMYKPSTDPLRDGTKSGVIGVEFYNGAVLVGSTSAPAIEWATPLDQWKNSQADAVVPPGTTRARITVTCINPSNGLGRFYADDVYLRNQSRGGGSLYVDNLSQNPAVVVKNHGTAKSAIFLYSVGDNSPDTGNDPDFEPDTHPWRYRYEVIGSIVKDYFGIQPQISVSGTNGYLCLADYRTTADGGVLIQVKNYMYDQSQPNGGSPLTFNISSPLLVGKTVRAFEQGRILEENSDGTVWIELSPDGHDILYAYDNAGGPAPYIAQLSDVPALVHPFGDKVYTVRVKYDALSASGAKLYAAFREDGDNGDGVSNEIYQVLTNVVAGNGEQWYYMWIPDPNQGDADYISTPDGGKYVFDAWLEDSVGTVVARAKPQPTALEWGVRVTNGVPGNVAKGQAVPFQLEWEDQYEQLWWQTTPLARNDSYPGRVAVYRSTKTEAQSPGHFNRVNEVCDWLENMGYQPGNDLDIGFDNVTVAGVMSDDFSDGNISDWTRIAGAANWTVASVAGAPVSIGTGNKIETSTTFSLSSTNSRVDYKVTADANKTIDWVRIYALRVGVSPTYSLSVHPDNGSGLPATNVILATATFTAPSTTLSKVQVDLPNYAWTKGVAYHLVMRSDSGTVNASNYVRLQYAGPNSAGRRVITSSNGGTTWTPVAYEPTLVVGYTDATALAQPYISVSALSLNPGNYRYGQKFRVGGPTTVTNVSVYLKKQATVNGDLSLAIRNWTTKALIASTVVSRTSIATNNTWVNFGFPSQPALAAGTQYYLELRNLGTVGIYYPLRANALAGNGADSWGGTNDCTVYSSNTGTTWTSYADYDLEFAVQSPSPANQYLRAARIGNDDNILAIGDSAWANVTVSADIRYNEQDDYFDDAEIFASYVDRNNYTKVGFRNFYGFWRIRYLVRVNGVIHQQGWLYEFGKTNRPVEGAWYNLQVSRAGAAHNVYFNGDPVGTFYATNFPNAQIALGSRAVQLGIWEPQKGYYFIDDDENGYSQDPNTNGPPLNLDWGYLAQFYKTLVLPGVYAMNDTEAANMRTWIVRGMNSIIATDGGTAMRDETGAADLGRVEDLFGVAPSLGSISGITSIALDSTNDHYVTLDYAQGDVVAASGSGTPYTTPTRGVALGTATGGSSAPALIANVVTNNPDAPSKTFVFNFRADGGQLTGSLATLAQRAFEWSRGQANKVRIELKYVSPLGDPSLDLTVYTMDAWVLAGTGTTNLVLNVPSDGIMTGDDKFYWAVYTYAWDATNAWIGHTGFYSSGNDGDLMSISGKGLQILGATTEAFAGRDWDVWAGYNTRTTTVTVTFGIKDKGALQVEDDFNDGDYNGWTVSTNTAGYTDVRVTNGQLQASVITPYSLYTTITPNGLNITGKNITVEYDVLFTNGANEGGIMYRGLPLHINPQVCGWQDAVNITMYTSNRPASNVWSHVVVNIRDGSPYLMSDLYVNGRPVFVSEPIEVSSFNVGEDNVGLSAIFLTITGVVRWENVRIADEQYSLVSTNVFGEFVPNNPTNPTFWPAIPDYDPAMWEHEGSTLGGQYQWYLYARGEGLHSYLDTRVYFAPRLQVELSSFPTNLAAGTNVVVPVEWEQLPASNVPARLRLRLFEAFSGTIYVEKTAVVSSVTGSTNIPVTIPTMPPGSNYVWSTFIYPTNAIDPWTERFGSDDTFRFNEAGIGLEPETTINMTGVSSSGVLSVYSDSGIPPGASIFTWQGSVASFNGNFPDATAPEGTMSFYTSGNFWQGWGVFRTGTDMRTYSNGYLKFWVKSPVTVKVDLEGPQFTKRTVFVGATTNIWVQKSIPVTSFSGVVLSNMFGLFEATTESASTFYIDDVKWSLTP